MIFYFSGTGNSLWVAKNLAEFQGEQVVSIAEQMNAAASFSFSLKPGEKLGFVFPIYAWAPPKIVMDFIEKLEIKQDSNPYTFAVGTCGDTAGYTMKLLGKALEKRNLKLDSGFSVFMPNNYIILYDVDSKEEERIKLEDAQQVVQHINEVIEKKKEGVFECYEGSKSFLNTYVISPLFNKFALGSKKFHTENNCISCSLCERICPIQNIILLEGKPKWGDRCTKCLACIHRCPVQAIEYGKKTKNKGRYYNPNL